MAGLHEITRIRRDIRRRHAAVCAIEPISPHMKRVTFASPDLADFESPSHDDHVKIFFPVGAQDAPPVARDFTPRHFDRGRRTLTIDFVLHDHGAASNWVRSASIGSTVEIAGPRGSMVVADDFDWYLLIGDESALPAIGRRVEELREGVPVTTVVALDDEADRQSFVTAADWRAHWVLRGATTADEAAALIERVERMAPAAGDGFVWIAAETAVARAVRQFVIDTQQHPAEWVKASAYWTRDRSGEREPV